MRDRALVPVSILLFALAAAGAPAASAAGSQAPAAPEAAPPAPGSGAAGLEIVLRLEDLETQMLSGSPRTRVIDQQPVLVAAERDAALRWSAPSLAWDLEDADGRREWQVTLGKRFERPLAQGAVRAAWDQQQRSASLGQEQARRDLLVDLRAGYVRMALLQSHRGDLDGLSAMLATAATVARERHANGVLAGTEARLLGLSAQAVAAIGRRVDSELRQTEANWRADLGLPEAGALRLASEVGFVAFALPDPQRQREMLADQPGAQALAARAQALAEQARALRTGFVPGLEAYGGFRRFGDEADGIVAGLAVELPVTGHDAALARRHEADRVLVEHERGLVLARARHEAAALHQDIAAAQAALAGFTAEMAGGRALPAALLLSFREGTLPLESLLSAVQVQAAAFDSYYAELDAYYHHLFRLEAVTGEAIVRFAPKE